jgi:hypothetical protein
MSFLSSKLVRIAAGVVVVSAIAAAPASAQDTTAEGAISAGTLVFSPPAITDFAVTLSGLTQTVATPVAAYTVADATGSNDGYNVTVEASDPTVGAVEADAGTGASLTLAPGTASANAGNPRSNADAPVVVAGPLLLSETPQSVMNADAATGQGVWDVTGSATGLSVVIPGDASAGAFLSTLTYTTGAPVI